MDGRVDSTQSDGAPLRRFRKLHFSSRKNMLTFALGLSTTARNTHEK